MDRHPSLRSTLLAVACVTMGMGLCVQAQTPDVAASRPAVAEVSIDGSKAAEPISPYIYGQFIEHLGRCIYGGIWAEMLEDRKFFFPITAEYRPYRALEDSPFPVVGASPWQIIGSAEAVTMVKEDAFVGEHTPRIAAGGGIRQRDLAVIEGKNYVGSIWLAAPKAGASVEVSLVWGDEEDARKTLRIKGIKGTYRKYPLTFKAGAASNTAMLEILVRGGDVTVGTVSLMPADAIRGMRRDTLGLLKQLGATMYRWPGGNFVSGYDWRDGIGERDRRPPRKNPAWTGVEHNDFGLDEFIDFCREVGAEPVIAVNTGFGDDYSAAQEVEYCNLGPDTIGGRWRAKNGHARPYGVKTWCVGNEMFGPWQLGFMQLSHYVQKHNRVAQAMWGADPSLQLIGVGSLGEFNRQHDPDQKVGWTEGMLQGCADFMNYISEHFYRGRTPWAPETPDLVGHVGLLKQSILQKAEGHRQLQKKLGLLDRRPVPIAMDEWNYWHQPYVYGELGCAYDLSDALGVAAGLHEYFRNSDIVKMAHYAQTVNVIGCVKTTKTAAEFDTTALPLMLYRRYFGTVPVAVEHQAAPLDVSAALTADRKTLTVAAVNPLTEPALLKLNLGSILVKGKAQTWIITGDDPKAHNRPGEPRKVDVQEAGATDLADPVSVQPLSITLWRVPLR